MASAGIAGRKPLRAAACMAPGKESPTRARGEDELDIMEGAAAIGAGLPADSDSGSTSASSAAASGRPTTEAPPDVDDQFLCITVREAKGLVAKDYETASSDPWVPRPAV